MADYSDDEKLYQKESKKKKKRKVIEDDSDDEEGEAQKLKDPPEEMPLPRRRTPRKQIGGKAPRKQLATKAMNFEEYQRQLEKIRAHRNHVKTQAPNLTQSPPKYRHTVVNSYTKELEYAEWLRKRRASKCKHYRPTSPEPWLYWSEEEWKNDYDSDGDGFSQGDPKMYFGKDPDYPDYNGEDCDGDEKCLDKDCYL